METKFQLFRKITLENFMLHDHTSIDLVKQPIILITGANGSGKTQILDGLIICLGHIPSRARAKGLGSLVGENGEQAKVTLQIANPVINGRRAIETLDKDLNKVLMDDKFEITAKISKKESAITFYINDSRRIIRGRTVKRRDIRRIFQAIGVRGDNQLAFTGEGTVDEFASKSPKRKLDTLLEVTGLQHYREEVLSAQEILKNSIREIEPLKRKLETETKLLNLWEGAFKILKRKKELLLNKTKLETELVWAQVMTREKQLDQLNQQRMKHLKEASDNKQERQKKKREIEEVTTSLERLEQEFDIIEKEERLKQRRVITLETQVQNEQNKVTDYEQEKQRFLEMKEQMEQVLATKDLSQKDRKIRNKQESLIIKNKKIALLQERWLKIEQELQELQLKLNQETSGDDSWEEGPRAGKQLTKYEQTMIHAATIFHRKIKQQGLQRELSGPIISLIQIKEEEKIWEQAVKNLMGQKLYSFIAKSDQSFNKAKQLYEEIWPNWKPPLAVFRVSGKDRENAETNLTKPAATEIYELASNLITGDPYAVGFLKRVVKSAVTKDQYDPAVLTKIAQKYRKNILTKSCNSYFLSAGGFGRPPSSIKKPMGWQIKETAEEKDFLSIVKERKIKAAIARKEKELREKKLEEIKTLEEITRLHKEIQTIGTPDEKLLGKIETTNEIIVHLKNKMMACQRRETELRIKLTTAEESLDRYQQKYGKLKLRRKKLQEIKENLRFELHTLEEKNNRLTRLEEKLDEEFEQLKEELKSREALANKKGGRPSEIRKLAEIRNDLSRIEGHLESIGITNVDEEKVKTQKVKVESLKNYMKEREEHIANLRADLEARQVFWSGELREVVTNISKAMQVLLSEIFEKVRLKVTNLQHPEKSGLYIEAVTKGSEFRDFKELSGGERVLAIEGLILAMHTLADSPLHAIDEFTQRLDEKNKALAFNIAMNTQKLAGEQSQFTPQFILLCPEALNINLSKKVHHIVVSELKVREK
ncbi:MAG: AAA family ATPase [Candidatus Heimdallarchaeota archaeon]|nr:AAA family ATPase [Candidatus Heimdallarchaeota archaeon]